jgi:hypothetical protein
MNIGQVNLFAADVLEKGTFIIKYVGPRISNKEVSRRCNTRSLFEINSCWTIDGLPAGTQLATSIMPAVRSRLAASASPAGQGL